MPTWSGTERVLAGIWRELLDVDVDRDDDFFELGGDSLIAMRVVSWVWQRLGLRMSVREIYDARRLASLAAVVDARLAQVGPAFGDGPVGRRGEAPQQADQRLVE